MKTIVIGSRGLIAPCLIKKLKKLKHEVSTYHHDDELTFTEADYIFFISSYGNHYHQTDTLQILEANVIDYIKLLRYSQNIPYRGLFYFSSSSVTLPVQTDYSDAKYMGEIIGKRFHKKYKKPIVSIRPSSVYGEEEAPFRLFTTAIDHVLQGTDMPITEGYHDWIYVEDFVDALVLVMQSCEQFIGRSIQIGTGHQTSNHQVLRAVMKLTGKHINLVDSDEVKRNFDTKNWVADTTVIKSLGWKQKFTLEKGLQAMIQHYVTTRPQKKSH
jgi:nucleoside-diphosphate-sugar epimerase